MSGMLIADIRHLLDDSLNVPADIPRPALNLLNFLLAIVEDVTDQDDPTDWAFTDVKCRRRPGRKPCPGFIVAFVTEEAPDRIYWECPICSDRGYISGWKGLRLPPVRRR